jgi:FlaA1/EpsC-like NDP-sugar epimerase
MPLALFFTLALKRGSIADAVQVPVALYVAAALLPAAVLVAFRTYRAVFRFVSSGVLFRSALAVLVASVLLAAFNWLALGSPVSTNAIVIFTAFALLHIVGSRALAREWLYLRRGLKERIVIYGAGVAGAQLAGSLRDSGQASGETASGWSCGEGCGAAAAGGSSSLMDNASSTHS